MYHNILHCDRFTGIATIAYHVVCQQPLSHPQCIESKYIDDH